MRNKRIRQYLHGKRKQTKKTNNIPYFDTESIIVQPEILWKIKTFKRHTHKKTFI